MVKQLQEVQAWHSVTNLSVASFKSLKILFFKFHAAFEPRFFYIKHEELEENRYRYAGNSQT